MSLFIKNQYKPVTEEILKKVEFELGFTFPESYRKFLLEYNGGEPFPKVFKTKVGEVFIRYFYSILERPTEETNLLDEIFYLREEGFPENFIPIGVDGFGHDATCICISGENYGKIYHVDLDDFYGYLENQKHYNPKQGNYRFFKRIANNFTDFINSYKEDKNENNFKKLLDREKYDEALEYLKGDIDLFQKYKDEFTLLDIAVKWGTAKMVEFLLNNGVKTNRAKLNDANSEKKSDILNLLLKYGFNPNESYNSITNLMWSSRDLKIKCVKVLLENGADVNLRDINGKSALTYALEGQKKEKIGTDLYNRYEEIIVLLKEHGATE